MATDDGGEVISEARVVGREGDDVDPTGGRRISFHLVAPRGSVVEQVVDEVTAPGALGDFGVLPGHVPMLAALRPGVLSYRVGSTRTWFAVGGGYAQVGAAGRLNVLVDRAVPATEIDAAEAKAELERLTAERKGSTAQGADLALLDRDLAWAQAQVNASEASRPRS